MQTKQNQVNEVDKDLGNWTYTRHKVSLKATKLKGFHCISSIYIVH